MVRTLGRFGLVFAVAALGMAVISPASSGEPQPPRHNCRNPAGHEPSGQCKKLPATTTLLPTTSSTSTSTTTSTSTSTTTTTLNQANVQIYIPIQVPINVCGNVGVGVIGVGVGIGSCDLGSRLP